MGQHLAESRQLALIVTSAVQVLAKMAAGQPVEKYQDRKTDEGDPGSGQITPKRLPFENRQPHPSQ